MDTLLLALAWFAALMLTLAVMGYLAGVLQRWSARLEAWAESLCCMYVDEP